MAAGFQKPRVCLPAAVAAAGEEGRDKVRAVFVDGGGVILNGMPVPMLRNLVSEGGPLQNLGEEEKGLVVGAHKANYHAWSQVKLNPDYTEEMYWNDMVKGTPMDGKLDPATLGRRLRDSFLVYEEVVSVVRDVRDKHGCVVGVVSNHATNWFDEMADNFGLRTVFEKEMIIVSQTVKMAKPNQDIYAEMFRRAKSQVSDLLPHHLVFVDDKQENIDAVVEYGCIGITFDNTKHSADDLKACLADLCGPF